MAKLRGKKTSWTLLRGKVILAFETERSHYTPEMSCEDDSLFLFCVVLSLRFSLVFLSVFSFDSPSFNGYL